MLEITFGLLVVVIILFITFGFNKQDEKSFVEDYTRIRTRILLAKHDNVIEKKITWWMVFKLKQRVSLPIQLKMIQDLADTWRLIFTDRKIK